MRSQRDFFQPLALGAPEPMRDIPVRPSRMIHFFDPSNPKMAEKAPAIAAKVDIPGPKVYPKAVTQVNEMINKEAMQK